jgi:hypothetical protein
MIAIEREFAGCKRTFALLNDYSATGLVYEGEGVTLPDLAQKAVKWELGAAQVRHVLVHALCQGRMRNLIAAQDLVDAEMAERPYIDFVPLAAEILEAAYAGRQ